MLSTPHPKCLSIIIPALNEEEAIRGTINRCLSARNEIKSEAGLEHVEIIVINDGSTDLTAEIAQSFANITLINLEANKGYGAAIKHGFSIASGDLLGFLDGDGTCEPRFFVSLCKTLIETSSDIVTGSRMHNKSKMPRIRRMGNLFYAKLMSALAGCKVQDTASGMRVIRKPILHELYPLPDGLHFTPAMTCRALLKDSIKFMEIEMPYSERQGISKLSIFRDGLRFLLAITEISLTYRPLKYFGGAGLFLFAIALFYAIGPLHSKLIYNILPESAIYRLLTINTLILAGLTLISVGIVAERIAVSLNNTNARTYTGFESILLELFSIHKMLVTGPLLILSGILLNTGPIVDYLTTLHISYHWGYISTGALLVLTGLQLFALGVFERLIETVVKESKPNK